MKGKHVVIAIVLSAVVAGGGLWYTQEYAFYSHVSYTKGQEVLLTPQASDTPQPIVVSAIQGIDASSSPLRYRACFTTPTPLAQLQSTYRPYKQATPLYAPGWFSCFDAGKITRALASGAATAFLGRRNIVPASAGVEIDRVVAIFADGHGYAWNQLAPGTEP